MTRLTKTAGAGRRSTGPSSQIAASAPAPAAPALQSALLVIGIDPGVITGFATYDARSQQLMTVDSCELHVAMDRVRTLLPGNPFVIFEDARKRKWFRKMDLKQEKYGAAIREGAGSAKRESKAWEQYLDSLGVPYFARPPLGTKMKHGPFVRLTKWQGRTNEHARDAAMMLVGINAPMLQGMLRAFQARTTSPGKAR